MNIISYLVHQRECAWLRTRTLLEMAQPSLCVFLLVVTCTTYTTALRDQQILSAPLACTTVSTCKAVCSNGITLNISDLFKYTP